MEIECKKAIEIEEGRHIGKITKIAYRTQPYEYTDVFIQPDDSEFELVYGCPTYISPISKLGRLIAVFTGELKVGQKYDPEKILLGKKVSFLVQKKKGKDNREYYEIVTDSIK